MAAGAVFLIMAAGFMALRRWGPSRRPVLSVFTCSLVAFAVAGAIGTRWEVASGLIIVSAGIVNVLMIVRSFPPKRSARS